MNAFISYSHKDEAILEKIHTHLSQLKRDGQLSSWTDEEILAGGELNQNISKNLESSQIFIALISPDYIASHYCYEKEFQRALALHESGRLTIIPVIVEPCDWLSTPFKKFKALPKDGKAISTWQNTNTGLLDVTQGIRKFLSAIPEDKLKSAKVIDNESSTISLRNYRVKKDFDSIQKLEFTEQTFVDIRRIIETYIDELLQVDDQIKCRIISNQSKIFEAILVNRNKIGSEANLKIHTTPNQQGRNDYLHSINTDNTIAFTINNQSNQERKIFSLSFDDFHMYWSEEVYFHNRQIKELSTKEIADIIWEDWLASVGII